MFLILRCPARPDSWLASYSPDYGDRQYRAGDEEPTGRPASEGLLGAGEGGRSWTAAHDTDVKDSVCRKDAYSRWSYPGAVRRLGGLNRAAFWEEEGDWGAKWKKAFGGFAHWCRQLEKPPESPQPSHVRASVQSFLRLTPYSPSSCMRMS